LFPGHRWGLSRGHGHQIGTDWFKTLVFALGEQRVHALGADGRALTEAHALEVLRKAEHGPDAYVRLRGECGGSAAALGGLADATARIEAEVDALRRRADILYARPP